MGKEWGNTLRTGEEIENSYIFFFFRNRKGEVDQVREVEEISGQTNVEQSQSS